MLAAQIDFNVLPCAFNEHLPQKQQKELTQPYNTNNPKQNALVHYVRSISGDTISIAVPFIEELKTNQAVIEHGIIHSQTLKCVSHIYTWFVYDRAMERCVRKIIFTGRFGGGVRKGISRA